MLLHLRPSINLSSLLFLFLLQVSTPPDSILRFTASFPSLVELNLAMQNSHLLLSLKVFSFTSRILKSIHPAFALQSFDQLASHLNSSSFKLRDPSDNSFITILNDSDLQ